MLAAEWDFERAGGVDEATAAGGATKGTICGAEAGMLCAGGTARAGNARVGRLHDVPVTERDGRVGRSCRDTRNTLSDTTITSPSTTTTGWSRTRGTPLSRVGVAV